MKLIELVALNISEWPTDAHCFAQDLTGLCYSYESAPSFDGKAFWIGVTTCGSYFGSGNPCEDYATTYITRQHWEAHTLGIAPHPEFVPAGIEHTTEAPPLDDDQVPPASMDLVTAGARLAEIAAELKKLKAERDAIGAIVTSAGFTFDDAEYARPLRDIADVKAGMLIDMTNPRIDSQPCRVVVSWVCDGDVGYVYPDGEEYRATFCDDGVSLFARPN